VLAPLTDDDPRQIGPYVLQNRIGAGGMGAVYLGFGPDREPVAVKVPTPSLAGDPEFRARFRTEVEAARRVRGLSVAAVIDADVDSPNPWMATEYVEGRNLSAAVAARGALDDRLVRGLAVGLADALVAIHAAGVVHRDLKPSNILLSWDGPKVIDFGVARATDGTSHTKTGVLVGTLVWMSPEQLRGDRAGTAADIFAWGACVAFAATGRPPFRGERPEAAALQIMTIDPDLEGAPADLVPILRHAMAKEPADRPSATELVEALVGSSVRSAGESDDAASTALASWWSLTPPNDGTPPGGAAGWGSATPPRATPMTRRAYERQGYQDPGSDPRDPRDRRPAGTGGTAPYGADAYGAGPRGGYGYGDRDGYANSDPGSYGGYPTAGAYPTGGAYPGGPAPAPAGGRRTSRGAVITIAAAAALLLGGGVAGAVILANNAGGHHPDTITAGTGSSTQPTGPVSTGGGTTTTGLSYAGPSASASASGSASASASASPGASPSATPTSNNQLTLSQARQMIRSQFGYTVTATGSWAPAHQVTVLVGRHGGDAHRQLAFFFVGGKLIGTDTKNPSAHISVADYTDTTVELTYATYTPDDDINSPSSSQNVTYTWNGSALVPNSAIPPEDPNAPGSRR